MKRLFAKIAVISLLAASSGLVFGIVESNSSQDQTREPLAHHYPDKDSYYDRHSEFRYADSDQKDDDMRRRRRHLPSNYDYENQCKIKRYKNKHIILKCDRPDSFKKTRRERSRAAIHHKTKHDNNDKLYRYERGDNINRTSSTDNFDPERSKYDNCYYTQQNGSNKWFKICDDNQASNENINDSDDYDRINRKTVNKYVDRHHYEPHYTSVSTRYETPAYSSRTSNHDDRYQCIDRTQYDRATGYYYRSMP